MPAGGGTIKAETARLPCLHEAGCGGRAGPGQRPGCM